MRRRLGTLMGDEILKVVWIIDEGIWLYMKLMSLFFVLRYCASLQRLASKQNNDTFTFFLERLLFDLGQDIFSGKRLEIKTLVKCL